MQIDRLLYPITTLGPGERLVIWTIGCSKHCDKCANPELWRQNQSKDVEVEQLVLLIKQNLGESKIDGVTITGGDPLEQISELSKLLPLLKEITDDILVFTGFTVQEAKTVISCDEWKLIKQNVTALIDGVYIDDLNDNVCALRGSTNQEIIFFDESKKERYFEYVRKDRVIQNVFHENKMISVGIHGKDYKSSGGKNNGEADAKMAK
jgi:anaerobic ribonucleoside-triphosphate reductase activating protein